MDETHLAERAPERVRRGATFAGAHSPTIPAWEVFCNELNPHIAARFLRIQTRSILAARRIGDIGMTENQPPDSASPKKPQPMDYLPLGIIVAAAVLAILGKLTEEGIGPLMIAAMVLLVVFVVLQFRNKKKKS